ncbi:hypothetical protein [Streptomyces sp. NPDC058045]|uniref:hypothetical protein n=1 Tax=Streptomyces sp. NPDC058045 TaxID=3346311 RepID=UPI0036E315EE
MPVTALLTATLAVGLEQLLQWSYGPMGVVGLTLLTVGVRSGNHTCSSVGALVLALLLTGPAA